MRRVVITGIGVICPIGIGAAVFWDHLLAGKSGISAIEAFDPAGFPSRIAGQIPAYKIGDYVPKSYRKATKVMARDIELAVVAADDAFKNSGLKSKAYTDTPTINPVRFGCNIGAALISAELGELTTAMYPARDAGALDLKKWGSEGMNNLTPLWLLKYLPNMLACHVTIIHELKGPSNTITCADASSHLAIGEAFRTIQRGKADLAICGGAESRINPMGLIRQTLLKRVTEAANDAPATALRPFDVDAAGTVIGEGGGLFIIEEYEHARARGARIYAELVGFGASQDAYRVTEAAPDGHSYGTAIAKALQEAGVAPDEVGCMVPHGLGLPSHDKAELAGLKLAFGQCLETVPMATIKGQIANMGAAGAIDAAAAVLSVAHGTVPPAANVHKVRDGMKLNVSSTPRSANVQIAVSSVYSLGGQNAALVFKKV